jgi:hypothetical protein
MRRMKNLLLSFILLFTPLALLAQKGDVIIHIKFSDGWGGTSYVDIFKKEKAIISSPHFGKIRVEELRKDTGFLNLGKNRLKYGVDEFKEKQQGFYNRYSMLDTTTVTIDLKKDRQYHDILKLIATASKATLEKNHEIKDKVMDAGDATFTITTDKNTKIVYAQGLFEQRYPILTKFVILTDARLHPEKMNFK